MEDIGKAFSFPFEDKDWLTKTLIAGLIGIVPILNFAFYGAMLDLMREVTEGRPATLPTWNNFGEKWKKGLFVFLAVLIYALPIIILYACATGFIIAGSADQNSDSINPLIGIGLAITYGGMCLVFVYEIALGLIAPYLAGMHNDTSEFGAFFRIREALSLARENLGDTLIVFLLAAVASVIGSLGIYLCFIGIIFTLPYSLFVTFHLFGQLYRKTGPRRQTLPAV